MSITMFLGRVVLPASTALLALALAWRWEQNASLGSKSDLARTVTLTDADQRASPRENPGGRVRAEGRVSAYPGAEVTVGTEVLGTIVSMPAGENAAVHKGDLLVELRADEVRAGLREARSRLTEAEVGLRLEHARSGLDRILPALKGQPPPSPEARRETLNGATARRDAARAAFELLEARATRYRILAPIDGVVVSRHAVPGETVSPVSPLVTIVDLTRLRVEAEVDEFDIPRITRQAQVTITAEGYRGRGWRGQVEAMAPIVVPRQTLPADPARPADTRILIVNVALLEPHPLKLGQRVEVEIREPDGGR